MPEDGYGKHHYRRCSVTEQRKETIKQQIKTENGQKTVVLDRKSAQSAKE